MILKLEDILTFEKMLHDKNSNEGSCFSQLLYIASFLFLPLIDESSTHFDSFHNIEEGIKSNCLLCNNLKILQMIVPILMIKH